MHVVLEYTVEEKTYLDNSIRVRIERSDGRAVGIHRVVHSVMTSDALDIIFEDMKQELRTRLNLDDRRLPTGRYDSANRMIRLGDTVEVRYQGTVVHTGVITYCPVLCCFEVQQGAERHGIQPDHQYLVVGSLA